MQFPGANLQLLDITVPYSASEVAHTTLDSNLLLDTHAVNRVQTFGQVISRTNRAQPARQICGQGSLQAIRSSTLPNSTLPLEEATMAYNTDIALFGQ